jgi:solute:Na+ symporter, SSS family
MIVVAVGLYAVLLIVLGQYSSKHVASQEDYLVAGRRLPLWLAWGTLLATWFGAGTIIGASEAARDEGIRGTLLDPFASGIALIVAGLFFARRMWKMNLLTMGDFFARHYGPRTETISSIVQAVSYFPWLAAQFVALGGILNGVFGWPMPVTILIAAGFVLYLTFSGGMWSVTLTDTAQAFVLLVSLVILGYSFFAAIGDGSAASGLTDTWEGTPADLRTLLPESYMLAWLAWTATLTTGVLGNIPGQDLMQRVFAARSAATAAKACVLAGCVYLLFGALPVLLGLASRIVLPDSDTSGILVALADQFLSGPMHVVFIVALLSIIVSTATSALLSPAALLGRNVLEHHKFFRYRPLTTNRMCVVVSAMISIAFAFAGSEVLGLLEQALEISLVALLVPFLGAFFGKPRGDTTGVVSIGSGAVAWLVFSVASGWLVPAELEFVRATWWQSMLLVPDALVGLAASLAGYVACEWTVGNSDDSRPSNAASESRRDE